MLFLHFDYHNVLERFVKIIKTKPLGFGLYLTLFLDFDYHNLLERY